MLIGVDGGGAKRACALIERRGQCVAALERSADAD